MSASHDDTHHQAVGGAAPVFALTLPAVTTSVPPARRRLLEFAELHGARSGVLGPLAVAMSEAVTNAVVHAYDEGDDGVVHITADIVDGALEVIVSDEGHGIRPGDSAGLGLGLKVIADLADRF
jgi:serine/threonine-protein kinase RsbW